MKIRDLIATLQTLIIDHPEVADAEILPEGAECWGKTAGVSIQEGGCTLLAREPETDG